MKRNSVVLTFLLVISLIFAVSCPTEKPSAKVSMAEGDDANVSVTMGDTATRDVVDELSHDTFNEEAFNVTAGNETVLDSWFTSSDTAKATVSAKIKSLEEVATTKADDAKKYVKAVVGLTITPVSPTEDTPVTVAFAIPKVTGNEKKWTTSGEELKADNEISITVEPKKEPKAEITSPKGESAKISLFKGDEPTTLYVVIKLTNDTFNTDVIKEAEKTVLEGWFKPSDESKATVSANVERLDETTATVKLTITAKEVTAADTPVSVAFAIPKTDDASKKWTTSGEKLEATNEIEINVKATPTLTLTSPVGEQKWNLFHYSSDLIYYDLELTLENDKFNTEKLKEGVDICTKDEYEHYDAHWFDVIDGPSDGGSIDNRIRSAIVQSGSNETTVKIKIGILGIYSPNNKDLEGYKLSIKIPKGENWTESNSELIAENNITINSYLKYVGYGTGLMNGYVAPECGVIYDVGTNNVMSCSFDNLVNGVFADDADISMIRLGDEFENSNFKIEENMVFFDNNGRKTLSVWISPETTAQASDDGTVLKFYVSKEAFTLDDKTGYYCDEYEYTINIQVQEKS